MDRLCRGLALGALAATAAATPAGALEPLTFGNLEVVLEGGVNLTAVRDRGDTVTNGYVDLYLIYRQPVGALTFGAELYGGVTHDSEADRRLVVNDDPYIDLGLWLEGERFGYLAWSYTSSAIGEDCIEAPSTGDNFDHGDYVAVGTCPAFDARSVLYYRTPDLGYGLRLGASYMPQSGLESVEDGEAAESISLALLLDRTDAGGAQWTGSLGFERVLAVEGGGPEPTAFQAGLNRASGGWTVGGALALVDNGDGSEDRGLALGVSRQFGEMFSASLGVNDSRSRAGGAQLDETSVALIGMVSFVPDKVLLDGGIWQIRTDDAGVHSDRTVIGLGLSLYF